MPDLESGLQAWRQMSNHNSMIELQDRARQSPPKAVADVDIAYFGSSAFRITTPLGLSLMVDPWRNYPTGTWSWYFRDFPRIAVDVGVSSHAHFDHDALHRLDAHVLLDRLIGTYEFADLRITGIAEKHETDSRRASYDFKKLIKTFQGIDIEPPNNPRSWDHCLLLIETGDLRILHCGDNRHNPPSHVLDRLGTVDILLLPVDASMHVMGYDMAEKVIESVQPKVVIPHHYYIWDMVQRQSTLREADEWVESRPHVRLDEPSHGYSCDAIADLHAMVHFFGDHVAFDKERWRAGEFENSGLNP